MLRIDATTICGLAGRLLLVALCHAAGWNGRNQGARGDRQTNATPAVQARIDSRAPSERKATSVPPGGCRCGQLRLCSDATLHWYAGGALLIGPDEADYGPGRCFPCGAGTSPRVPDGADRPADVFSHISTGW